MCSVAASLATARGQSQVLMWATGRRFGISPQIMGTTLTECLKEYIKPEAACAILQHRRARALLAQSQNKLLVAS